MKREPQTNLAKKDVLFQYEEGFFISLIVTDFQNHVEYIE